MFLSSLNLGMQKLPRTDFPDFGMTRLLKCTKLLIYPKTNAKLTYFRQINDIMCHLQQENSCGCSFFWDFLEFGMRQKGHFWAI